MRTPFGWGLVAIAVVAATVAILTRSNTGLALVAASAAIVAAALLFVEVGVRAWNPLGRIPAPSLRPPADGVRAAFGSGRLGREAVIVLLDRLSRTASGPARPPTSLGELDAIGRMSAAEFRAYVRTRVEYLEDHT